MPRADIANPEFSYDPDDPEGYKAGLFRPGKDMGAKDSGASIYELPPGQAVCPYHYEYGEEEWLLVLSGAATVRTPDGTVTTKGPDELWFFPKGPDGAHKISNETGETIRVLMWSTVVHPTATAYPDSDKVGVYTGFDGEDVRVQRSSGVGYYHGEPGT